MGVATAALTSPPSTLPRAGHASQGGAEPEGLTIEDMGNAPGTRPLTSLGPALACAARAAQYVQCTESAVLPAQDQVHTALAVHDKHARWRAFFGKGGPGQLFSDATSLRLLSLRGRPATD